MNDTELRDRRLVYKARRGLKEIDFFLDPYIRGHFAQASEQEKQALDRLLDAEDPDLMDWFLGASSPSDLELMALVDRIRALKTN